MRTGLLISCAIGMALLVYAVPPAPGIEGHEPLKPRLVKNECLSMSAPMRRAANEDGEGKGLCILVNYSDTVFQAVNTRVDFDSLANGEQYTYNGATGSVRSYFRDQSNGLYVPHFDVVGPVTLSRECAFYGQDWSSKGDDRYPVDLVLEACFGAKELGIDFSQYDEDEDGVVDFVYIIYAGEGQADGGNANTIWPHEWDLESALAFGYTAQDSFYVNINEYGQVTDENLPVIDGKMILLYACSNELRHWDRMRTGIGTMCHEFSHVLGLPDYYITNASAPMSNAGEEPSSWSIMSQGPYLNNGNTPPNYSVYDKYFIGWLSPTFLSTPQMVDLPADGLTYFCTNRSLIEPEEGPLSTDTMYYFENRQQSGWDAYLPGHGMLVWQVVYDSLEWVNNTPNNNSTRYFLQSSIEGSHGYSAEPFPGDYEVSSYECAGQSLSSITEEDGVVSFIFNHYDPSGCESVEWSTEDGPMYNILGMPVDAHYQGIVIHKHGKILRL